MAQGVELGRLAGPFGRGVFYPELNGLGLRV